jgi:predicted TIM-barrel fold metal-dependent hydrolase
VRVFDCNVWYGRENRLVATGWVPDMSTLATDLENAGVAHAVVANTLQRNIGAVAGNRALTDDLKDRPHLWGVWAILPTHTHELPQPEAMADAMEAHRIAGFRLYPESSRFLPRVYALEEWLEVAVRRRIPVFVDTHHGTTLDDVTQMLEAVPGLIVVLTYRESWPSDRILRPMVARHPGLYLDLSYFITEGGIAAWVRDQGPERLLYGSGYPDCYLGANLLMLKHAAIPEADRELIAAGNLQRLIEEIR